MNQKYQRMCFMENGIDRFVLIMCILGLLNYVYKLITNNLKI